MDAGPGKKQNCWIIWVGRALGQFQKVESFQLDQSVKDFAGLCISTGK